MEFVKLIPINRICPCCGNGNYMRIISGKYVGELNVKCINCNSYYNYDELLKRDNSKPLNGADGRTMDDLISRAAAIDALKRAAYWQDGERKIAELPAVDAVPHGRWVADSDGLPVCSVCDEVAMQRLHCDTLHGAWRYDVRLVKTPYCPHCGAKMDGEQHLAFADQSGAEYADNPTV